MVDFETLQLIRTKYDALYPIMDERTRRYWAASEALALGWGGTSAVARATGLSRPTIIQGIRALKHQSVSTGKIENSLRVRRPGGGRKSVTTTDRGLQRALPTVTRLLHDLDYSLQANRKTREGADHPDRDERSLNISAGRSKRSSVALNP